MPTPSKLKAFFRSRSRSRPQPSDPPPVPAQLHPDNPPSSYHKSSLRSQNRPISSTTTATHSTITPLPSDALRNRRHVHLRSPDAHRDHDRRSDTSHYDSDDNHFPRSETPSSTRRKPAWHAFFGISLTRRSSSTTPSPDRKASTSTSASSPRKRSFRLTSRPTTPKSVESSSPHPIPTPSSPLPLSASPRRRSFGLGSQRSTPRSSAAHLPLPLPSPQPARSHGRRHSLGSERPPHDSAVALQEVPSKRAPHKPPHDGPSRSKGKEKEKLVARSDALPPLDFPSQSLPSDPSRIHPSSHLPRHPGFPNLPTLDSASSDENEQPTHRLHGIPQIVHTPPTPQRPGEDVDFPSRSSPVLPRLPKVAIAHREQVLVSGSQSHAVAQHAPSRGRFTARFLSTKDVPKPKDADRQKSSKRPSASHDAPGHKTLSLARNMTSHRGKLGSFDFERPISGLNRSNSTVDRQKPGPTDNSSYSKARLHSLEQTTSHESVRGDKSQHLDQAESPMPDHTGDASVISFSTLSLQTKSTGLDVGSNTTAGQSSSWGRASGRHILRTSHGTFAFEHPSSLPNSPNPHTFNLPNDPNQNGRHETGLPQSQPGTPALDGRMKHSRGQSCGTSDQPSYGERKSKGKGRSLDLGLGLSWAPSRLREEVLMPGLILEREKAKLQANGLDVTKTFESLLSESRFQTFKKYVRRFDAHVIPLQGPSGLLARVENLLAESGLGEQERSQLMSDFTVFVENHGG